MDKTDVYEFAGTPRIARKSWTFSLSEELTISITLFVHTLTMTMPQV
jgi:hypothetical protein